MTDNSYSYSQIVTSIATSEYIFVLAKMPQDSRLFSNAGKEYIGYNLDSGGYDGLCFFNTSEVAEVKDETGEFEKIEYNPSFPVFENSLTMNAKVRSIENPNETGIIVAINPVLIPLSFDYSYLVLLDDGTYKKYEHSEIEYAQ